MRETTIKFLRAKEWSMGNGQCPECCGVSEGWLGHPLHLDSSNIGHELDCPLAECLNELGEWVLYIGSYKNPDKYEISWEGGFLHTVLIETPA